MVQTSVESGQPVSTAGAPSPAVKTPGALPWETIARAGAGVVPAMTELLKQFWGVPVKLVFFSASTKAHYFWKLDDFHVSQLMLGELEPGESDQSKLALLRLSDAACSSFLTRTLGQRNGGQKHFSFKQLSPLEATILNEFSRDLLSSLMKSLIKKPGRNARTEQVHLMWVVQADAPLEAEEGAGRKKKNLQFRENFELGKIILSLPAGAIRLEHQQQEEPVERVSDSFFFHVEGAARVYLGSTRIALSDLNQLEPEDLVILEDSHVERMALVEPDSGEHLEFAATIRNHARITIPYTQELASMETQQMASARQSLWDNLMIEVTAEFEPIKLPLKQIKQMSEGLVVEMGDLIHNQICLQVEGKTLAWGELIIVGDKFGVRISKVEPEPTAEAQEFQQPVAAIASQSAAPEQAAMQQAPQAEAGADENSQPAGDADEENLDNFLNDDFDENFEEEEDW